MSDGSDDHRPRWSYPSLVEVGGVRGLHLFATGHFSLKEYLPGIAGLVADFLDHNWT